MSLTKLYKKKKQTKTLNNKIISNIHASALITLINLAELKNKVLTPALAHSIFFVYKKKTTLEELIGIYFLK